MSAIVSWTTTAKDGHLRAPGALEKHLRQRRLPAIAATGEQIHRARMAIVPALKQARTYSSVDGLLTREPNQPLAIFTADCVPLFLQSRDGKWVGVLHAGWRGVQQQILKAAVRLLWSRDRIPARSLQVWAGPSIGPCCFEVRWDVARHFPGARRRHRDRWTVDLWTALNRQARQLGVKWKGPRPDCTVHHKGYHSYRRDQTDRRQVSVILKTGDHEK